MANIGKREFAKKDMNFFSEFAASSQAVARIMGYMIIGGIVVAAALVTACVILFGRWALLKAEVKSYDEKFKKPEYANLQSEADALSQEAAHINQYAYIMNQMVQKVDSETGVEFEIISEIEKNIPSNTILTYYSIDKDAVEIKGESHSYYAFGELGHMLQKNEFFTNSNYGLERENALDNFSEEQIRTMYTSGEYDWQFLGTLHSKYIISVSYVSVDNSVLKVEPSVLVEAGQSKNYPDVSVITIAGKSYDLVAISINGMTVSEEQVRSVLETNELSVSAFSDVQVQLQYTPRIEEG